ncbi:ectonucleotide pyrophosphatase/phosphodiesterase family member 3 [Pitangus sulphuratus]|nr:ectonucleotide pyrophosphatase/phosphodiesterase family member 3 [Pitangus sulphuratus]
MELEHDHRGTLEEESLKGTEYVKKKSVLKYKVICAFITVMNFGFPVSMKQILLCALVTVSLGLGLGLGLNRGNQEQVSCRHKCHEPRRKNVPGCQCDSGCKERRDCCWDYEDTCVEPTRSWRCTNFRCGETRIAGSHCSCSDDCLQKKDCCVNYKSVCKGETSWAEEPCVSLETPQCPAGFDLPPLILFSMDGFRAEYLETWSSLLPNIEKLKTCGTHSKYMRAVYPTKTFPNHYTIVTGLYPESHGIIDNNMYDIDLNEHFSLSGMEKFNPSWWKGQPIWLTAMYQNLKAGTFFWPGSDVQINGTYPNSYTVYNSDFWIPLKTIDTVLEMVIKALQIADQALGMLMDGLKQRNLHNCVNLIVLADHGMEKTYCNQLEYMTNYFKQVDFYMYAGPAARIRAQNVPNDYFTFDSEGIVKNLTCKSSPQHFKPYLTPDLPKRFHYANNIRIDKVHLLVDRQWLAVRDESYTFCDGGDHGYNNEFKSMQAIFLAYGPSFKEKTEVDAFENIEVYNLMCDLLRITPAPNNGTHGSLNHLLRKPFYSPSHPKEESSPSSCPVSSLIPEHPLGCQCMHMPNVTEEELNERLNLTTEENFSSSTLEQYDALLISNIVPMFPAFRDIWDYFHNVLLQEYARERNGVNVISGPVFDYNYDGHFDSLDDIKQHVNNTEIPVPTHYFVVLTSCKNKSYTPLNCSGSLDASSFIIPHRPDNTESCAENKTLSEWVEERIQAHSARVRDVELLTGLDFYQERNQEPISEILKLKTFLPVFEAEND